MLGQTNGGGSCGSAGDAHQQALFLGQTKSHLNGLVVGDLFHLVDDGEVEVLGNEAGADPLDLVGTWLHLLAVHGLGDHRAVAGFHGYRFNRLAFAVLDVTGHASNGAAGAHAGHQNVDGAFAVVPDLRTSGLFVNLRIGGILKLPGHEVLARVTGGDLLGFGDGARHAFGGFGEHDFSAENGHHAATFDRHRLGHREHELVTASGGGEGESNAGIA